MHSHDDSHLEPSQPFPLLVFTLATGFQVALTAALYYWIAPGTFRAELAHPGMIVLCTFLLGIPLSLFEYLYHRYLLHSAILPFLGAMHRAHSTHHGLTSVKAPVRPNEPDLMVPVKSEYPVEHHHQEESMAFPLYSIAIFQLIFNLLLGIPLKLLFPQMPWMIATIAAVTLAYSGYELWHAILHLSFDRFWKPLMEHKTVGKTVSRIYAFHLMHHWRPVTNLAVVGFWGFAVWDYVFRTHKRPVNLPLDEARVNYADAVLDTPAWPVSSIDKVQARMFKGSRRIEQSLLRAFRSSKPDRAEEETPKAITLPSAPKIIPEE